MRTSRTRPTKLATAPILLFLEIALTSAPRSKSSRWIEIFIRCRLSTCDRWKERHLVSRFDRRRRLRHVLVDRRAHRSVRREHRGPLPAPRPQMIAQRADRGDAGGQLQLLARAAHLLPQGGEEEDSDLHPHVTLIA